MDDKSFQMLCINASAHLVSCVYDHAVFVGDREKFVGGHAVVHPGGFRGSNPPF